MESTPEMKISALVPWFGGKRTLAPRIVAELGPHSAYWEPFCGGVSIIMHKERSRQEVLNDLHGDLTNLAMVVGSNERWLDLHTRISRALYSRGLFEACKAMVGEADIDVPATFEAIEDRHVERAFAYLVLSWMGRNGAAGTARINYQFTLRYTGNGGDSATRWVRVIESMPAWHERLSGVVINNGDGLELLEKIDDAPGAAIYCDPPYFAEGGAYKHTFGSGGGMFGRDDHERMADALRRFKHARVVVSYYADPRLRELYPGWTVCDVAMTKALAAQNKRGVNREEAPEVLLLNGPSLNKEAL